jgi:hypothetical protein
MLRLLSGAEMPLPPGHYTVILSISQDSVRRGITKTLPPVVIPEPTTTLSATELILGSEGNGMFWQSSTRAVPLNPYGEWEEKSTLTLFTQLRNLIPGEDYRVSLQLFRFDGKSGISREPVIALTFPEHAESSTAEWYREISTSKLDLANYCVVAEFSQNGHQVRLGDRLVVMPKVDMNNWDSIRESRAFLEKPELAAACRGLQQTR